MQPIATDNRRTVKCEHVTRIKFEIVELLSFHDLAGRQMPNISVFINALSYFQEL